MMRWNILLAISLLMAGFTYVMPLALATQFFSELPRDLAPKLGVQEDVLRTRLLDAIFPYAETVGEALALPWLALAVIAVVIGLKDWLRRSRIRGKGKREAVSSDGTAPVNSIIFSVVSSSEE